MPCRFNSDSKGTKSLMTITFPLLMVSIKNFVSDNPLTPSFL